VSRTEAGRGRASAWLICLVGLLLGPADSAHAQAPGLGGPSVDQYIESVPTARGPAAVAEPRTAPATRLPAETRRRLRREAGGDAAALEALSTDPATGAPAGRSAAAGRRGGSSQEDSAPAMLGMSERGSADAAAQALSGGGSAVLLLLAGLLAGTLALGAVAWRRRSSARP
jgi:hypothetical protein